LLINVLRVFYFFYLDSKIIDVSQPIGSFVYQEMAGPKHLLHFFDPAEQTLVGLNHLKAKSLFCHFFGQIERTLVKLKNVVAKSQFCHTLTQPKQTLTRSKYSKVESSMLSRVA